MIKFTQDCRDGISWFKGDIGVIQRTLASKPQVTSTIYIVKVRDRDVWATEEDFVDWNQLSLF